MTDALAAGAALIVIDVQRGFEQLGPRDNPDCEANVTALLAEWRHRGDPVVHKRVHSAFHGKSGSARVALHEEFATVVRAADLLTT